MAWWNTKAAAVDEGRWVMVDVEASGLDASRDQLLALAAIALRVDWPARRLAIDIGDSFEVDVRPDAPSARENILLHGIGVKRQATGLPPQEALAAFATFAGRAPLLAFHASFDRALVERHAVEAGLPKLANPWVDIEHLCGATYPNERLRSLDEWMARFGVSCAVRHQAASDALAQAELLLRIWPRVAVECRSWRDVERLARHRRWLSAS